MNTANSKAFTVLDHIVNVSKHEISETREMIEYYKAIALNDMTNSELFSEICWIVYTSGFRYDIIKKYWNAIGKELLFFDVFKLASCVDDIDSYSKRICRNSGFNNVKKAKWCIQNAARIIEIDQERKNCGGFKGYLLELSTKDPFELLDMTSTILKELRFVGIGKITIFHLLKNIGVNIFKPDIHVRRILWNLGLISSENSSIKDIYYVMKDVSDKMEIDLVELDTLLFSYGRTFGDKVSLTL